jgi:hypothetical protein
MISRNGSHVLRPISGCACAGFESPDPVCSQASDEEIDRFLSEYGKGG